MGSAYANRVPANSTVVKSSLGKCRVYQADLDAGATANYVEISSSPRPLDSSVAFPQPLPLGTKFKVLKVVKVTKITAPFNSSLFLELGTEDVKWMQKPTSVRIAIEQGRSLKDALEPKFIKVNSQP